MLNHFPDVREAQSYHRSMDPITIRTVDTNSPHWWLRILPLAAIAFIVIQTWLGQLCPLTLLESWLREQGGVSGYSQSFIEHWLQRMLFFEAPFWVFTVAYTLFGLLVVLAWRLYPPRGRRQ